MAITNPDARGFRGRWLGLLSTIALTVTATTNVCATPAVVVADLDTLLERVRAEVELLRFQMGKPANEQPPPAVDDVQPHEAFLQAQNLFRKTNRLARELIGASRQTPPVAPPAEKIVVADVYIPLEAALEQVVALKAGLGITAEAEPEERSPTKDLTIVYRVMVQTNRQLNLLTEQAFTAEGIYEQISLAITYAAGILSAYPDRQAIPESPPFQAGKSPDEVYQQLSACLRLNRAIAERIGFKLLRYDPRGFRRDEALPSDVYDLATLLVSYVGHIATKLDAPEVYPDIAVPERVFPAHAYQHASVLREQLTQITELMNEKMTSIAD